MFFNNSYIDHSMVSFSYGCLSDDAAFILRTVREINTVYKENRVTLDSIDLKFALYLKERNDSPSKNNV